MRSGIAAGMVGTTGFGACAARIRCPRAAAAAALGPERAAGAFACPTGSNRAPAPGRRSASLGDRRRNGRDDRIRRMRCAHPLPSRGRCRCARARTRRRRVRLSHRFESCARAWTQVCLARGSPPEWSGRQDSNLRHPAPKAGALPNCATSRRLRQVVLYTTFRKAPGYPYCYIIDTNGREARGQGPVMRKGDS